MARRRSLIANRLAHMKDLPPDERDLLVRIGQTIDSAINNRGPTNPHEDPNERRRSNVKLPPPSNITVERGVRTAKFLWDPVNSPILLHYKLTFLNKDSGEETVRTSFSNEFIFKGDGGNYKVLIKCIGRSGISSANRVLEIEVPDSVMILEGAKNDIDTIGFSVSETVYIPPNYTAFVWMAFTLNDESFQLANDTPTAVLKRRLSTEEAASDIEEQSVTLYPESETVTSLNNILGLSNGFAISRPTIGGAPARGSNNNETSQTIMFAPLDDIPEVHQGLDNTFTVEIQDRAQLDVKSLSIVIWVATGGRGFFTPPAPFTQHLNSLSVVRAPAATIGTDYSIDVTPSVEIIGNPAFSMGYWMKPLTTDTRGINLDIRNPAIGTIGAVYCEVSTFISGTAQTALLRIGTGSGGATELVLHTNTSSYIFSSGLNVWYHFVWTYSSSPRRVRLYKNGSLILSTSAGDGVTVFSSDSISGGSINPVNTASGTATQARTEWTSLGSQSESHRMWEAAIWEETELTAAAVLALYNSGDGYNFDISSNSGSYLSSDKLTLWLKYGKDTSASDTDLSIGATTSVIPSKVGAYNPLTVSAGVDATVIDDYPGK